MWVYTLAVVEKSAWPKIFLKNFRGHKPAASLQTPREAKRPLRDMLARTAYKLETLS